LPRPGEVAGNNSQTAQATVFLNIHHAAVLDVIEPFSDRRYSFFADLIVGQRVDELMQPSRAVIITCVHCGRIAGRRAESALSGSTHLRRVVNSRVSRGPARNAGAAGPMEVNQNSNLSPAFEFLSPALIISPTK